MRRVIFAFPCWLMLGLCRLMLVAACLIAALAVLSAALRFPQLAVILVAGIVWRQMTRGRGAGTAFGSAKPISFIDLARRGLLGEEGLILGRAGWATPPSFSERLVALLSPAVSSRIACGMLFGRQWCRNQIIRLKQFVHVATFSPTGGGKGVSAVIPNLLNYRRSAVVTDPKGEVFTHTATHRRTKFRHRILRLDPFAICGESGDALNPLDFIDQTAPDFLDQARDLANALVVRTGQEPEPHWNDSAERVLTAFIAFVAACESDRTKRNLQTVRALISSRSTYTVSVEVMQKTEGFGGVVQRAGHSLTWLAEKELASVLSVVQRHTAWMDSPAVASCLMRSSFDPRELRRGRMTVYLVLPPERLVTLAPLMRMWLSTLLRTLTRGAANEKSPVLFMIDEAAQLGRMQILEDALTLMRGYGIRLWLFFQSMGQLQKCYGDQAQTILENIGTQQYFGTNSYQAAEELSKRIGDATILLKSLNTTTSRSWPTGPSAGGPQPGNVSSSTSTTTSQTGRRWLKPEEVLTLNDDLALVFHKNLPVIPARLLKYHNAPEFRWGRSGGNFGIGTAAIALAPMIVLAVSALAPLAASQPFPKAREADTSIAESVLNALASGWEWVTDRATARQHPSLELPAPELDLSPPPHPLPDRGLDSEVTSWWPPPGWSRQERGR